MISVVLSFMQLQSFLNNSRPVADGSLLRLLRSEPSLKEIIKCEETAAGVKRRLHLFCDLLGPPGLRSHGLSSEQTDGRNLRGVATPEGRCSSGVTSVQLLLGYCLRLAARPAALQKPGTTYR